MGGLPLFSVHGERGARVLCGAVWTEVRTPCRLSAHVTNAQVHLHKWRFHELIGSTEKVSDSAYDKSLCGVRTLIPFI